MRDESATLVPTEQQNGLYLYCLMRAADAPEGPVTDEHASTPLHYLKVDALTAVCAQVPLCAFTGPQGDLNLANRDWVVGRVVAHQQVVAAQMSRGPVLPVRFGAVFTSLDALADRVSSWAADAGAFLTRTASLEEWDVKLFADEAALAKSLEQDDAHLAKLTQQAPKTAGAKYLFEKRLLKARREALERWSATCVEDLLAALRPMSVAQKPLLGAQRGADRLAPRPHAHVAVLVERARAKELRTALENLQLRCGNPAVTLRESGPWPPYSFVPQSLTTP